MMLRQYFTKIVLLLFLASMSSIVLANNVEIEKTARQIVESYCQIEFDGGWIEDRWNIIKFGSKRKAEDKIRIHTDASIFEIKHYPFIVISSYDIRDIQLFDKLHGTVNVVYRQLAHAVDRIDGRWHLIAEPPHDESVTLNLIFEHNKWWILDPPPPRISKDNLIKYYDYKIKNLRESGWISQPNMSQAQKAGFDNDVENLRILKSLP